MIAAEAIRHTGGEVELGLPAVVMDSAGRLVVIEMWNV
jgi:hypothetical protein